MTANHIKTARSVNESSYNLIIDNFKFLQVFNAQISYGNQKLNMRPIVYVSCQIQIGVFLIYVALQQIKKLIKF